MFGFKEKSACGVGFVADLSTKASRKILDIGIESVKNLVHRGAVSADGKTGDGAGILTEIPKKIIKKEVKKYNLDENKIAVGVFFFFGGSEKFLKPSIEDFARKIGLNPVCWRDVPVDDSALGEIALSSKPNIKHLLLSYSEQNLKEVERKLFILRKYAEKIARENRLKVYVPSISAKKIVYKGLFISTQIDKFYLDLQDPDYETSFCLFHQRYSTNTHPRWDIAQPFRYIAHNGEINTLLGNIKWMESREKALKESKFWSKEEIELLKPIIWSEGSDSSMLDNAVEIIYLSGADIVSTMSMLVPEPYEVVHDMSDDVRAFFEYHDYFLEPWDGPAALVFCDYTGVGACLDRNGLRPARYGITDSGILIFASELGVSEIPYKNFDEIGGLGPGEMLFFDFSDKKIYRNKEIKKKIAGARKYVDFTKDVKKIKTDVEVDSFPYLLTDEKELLRKQKAFGYTEEDIERFVKDMAFKSQESVYSMGDDTPFAFMSKVPRNIYSYFKQRFAQVTNPPIDAYRESIVMSLTTTIGEKLNPIETDQFDTRNLVRLDSPIITEKNLEELKQIFSYRVFEMTYDAYDRNSLEVNLMNLVSDVVKAVRDDGVKLVILSDRAAGDRGKALISPLLCVGAVHSTLIKEGLRLKCSIILDTGEPREEHHFACLLGYGADAILPYLAFYTAYNLKEEHIGKSVQVDDKMKLIKNYKSAVEKGIKKIMSKIGISVLSSYRGGKIFEIIGLSHKVVHTCFDGTPAWFTHDGLDFEHIARDYSEFYNWSKDTSPRLVNLGFFKFIRDKEYHMKNPYVFRPLHKFTETGDYNYYKEFTEQVSSREPSKVRDFFDVLPVGDPIPLDEVEPVESILKRFYVSSMSFGALSPEAHETLAIGVNRIGANMGSGEGGEDPRRFEPYENGDWANSSMKQIASGRFGVTTEYAVNCRELEIKIAQGAKPGEGGQLPGIKVNETIAKVRRTVPGISLISPPPHHDIYSIEDLAQLIYDLKKVNPFARVSVKLVSSAGVGIIASGVSKAYSDTVHIAGDEGGTGASPSSSIKNAGNTWELGLIETNAILIWNNIRDRVRIRVDGGLLNGWDVIKAAILGANEYGFGSSAMIAIGCIMARQCHLNTCPVGIASQREDLRKKFPGSPERIERYFIAVAEEVRQILAKLGARSLDQIIGRIDLIKPRGVKVPKSSKEINVDYLKSLYLRIAEEGENPFIVEMPENGISDKLDERIRKILSSVSHEPKGRNDRPENPEEDLNSKIVKDALPLLELGRKVNLKYQIRNIHRSVGATLSGIIAKNWGDGVSIKKGLEPNSVVIDFEGFAGQSFGAFLVRGIKFNLYGVANDYVGKAISGGHINIIPHKDNLMGIGNVAIYGGTGGYLFVRGRAGQRFAVRNSGVFAVVEGAGDHCLEYMTNGASLILGEVGKNLGAGMTGGIAFIIKDKSLKKLINPEFVFLKDIDEEIENIFIQMLLKVHQMETKSKIAEQILNGSISDNFYVIVPKEFQKYKTSFIESAINRLKNDFQYLA
ncbi:MAG: glutamate synthase large subunit [Candidatus Calescibacterium sp.]|nr:glutamate synthase large subunit [Candidatus Calescibacterium sp.]MDW8086371.1 glutamate synthase large subunit [Candidatus Calescibacterium sp.]